MGSPHPLPDNLISTDFMINRPIAPRMTHDHVCFLKQGHRTLLQNMLFPVYYDTNMHVLLFAEPCANHGIEEPSDDEQDACGREQSKCRGFLDAS